ncbi:S49 family peptidase [Gephyromycinifex aptenodytis]|uniref:S49 family peptidase n=1 Tax=Gephyromycinifex aptenodytis TaxID=2716227 RepID=UPI001447481A|nr:S49 family peptidase [Gephyromycinifex aptenodytis]
MSTLRDFLDRLPFDTTPLRKLPVPGLAGDCLLELDLTRGLMDSAPASPIEAVRERHTPDLVSVLEALRIAATDARVRALVVHAYAPTLSLAHADELRRGIDEFARSAKPTLAWAESFGELVSGTAGYLVAAACDEIMLQPSGDLGLFGTALEAVFLREALDKIDVLPQISRRHEYKSAAETFLESQISAPHEEMLRSITESVVGHICDCVADARNLQPSEVRAAMDEAPLSAQRALELGLVDRLGYRDEAYAAIREHIGDADGSRTELRFVERFSALPSIDSVRNRRRPVVALVHAQGAIHLGRSGASPLSGHTVGSDSLGAALRAVAQESRVKAVVLRIDSPGGSYTASDAIRREILALRELGLPIVASMGSVAASGGYFIAMPCTEIVAGPATLTGSIGVFGGKTVLQGGLDRLGIHRALVGTGERAGMFSSVRPFTQEEQAKLDAWLDEVYADFTAKAAGDRGRPLTELEPHARGRVWTGAEAAERGLVDHLGGLSHAIERACALAGLERAEAETVVMPKQNILERFTPADNSDATNIRGGSPLFAESAGLARRALLRLAPTGVLTMPNLHL